MRKKISRRGKPKKNNGVFIYPKTIIYIALYTFFIFLLAYMIAQLQNSGIAQSLAIQSKNSIENYKEGEIPVFIPSANVILHGDRNSKKIALTFDAEMTKGMKNAYLLRTNPNSYDKRIVDILNKSNTPATFFLTGMWMELFPEATKELTKNPLFEFGSHSYADTAYDGECYGLEKMTLQQKIQDIGITEKLLSDFTGTDNYLFRFPGGCYSEEDVKLINDAGDTIVHWDVAANDGFNNNTEQIVHNVIDNVKNGSIIVMHLNGAPFAPKTSEALPIIIEELKSKGYEFVKVSHLLNLQK